MLSKVIKINEVNNSILIESWKKVNKLCAVKDENSVKYYDDMMELARLLMNTLNVVMIGNRGEQSVLLFEIDSPFDGRRFAVKNIINDGEDTYMAVDEKVF